MQALGNERLNNRVFPEACVNLSPGEGSFLSSKDGDNAHKALKAETKAPHLVFISFWNNQNRASLPGLLLQPNGRQGQGCDSVVERLCGLHANLGFYCLVSYP